MSRISRDNVLAFVLAGGKGRRLFPLTEERTKPSVSFGGKYRIIDFTLSNLVNSGIYSIYVLVQYKSQSLIEHIRTSWRKFGVLPKHFITVVPPQMRKEAVGEWYRGTADSINHNINLIHDFKPRFVVVLGGDHVYRMNIKEMIDYHIRKKAQCTIAVTPAHSSQSYQLGIADVDSNFRIKKFREKPSFSGKKMIFASMGNYVFNSDFLVDLLSTKPLSDFGRDVIPYLAKRKDGVFAYDFSKNKIPSLKEYEAAYYWKDIGTISSYWQANMDLLGKQPIFDLDNRQWPIYASDFDCPPVYTAASRIENTLLSEGARVCGSEIRNSILGRSVTVDEGCFIEDSIIMDFTHVKKSSKIRKAIIDRFNTIEPKTSIGYNAKSDSRQYHLDPSGIVVVKRGSRDVSYIGL
ncbi:MAG: glucose-1-phosphate adenylyltransferase [Candidatus Omnitrophica bacterium]|nr:glucose-1-phosphate adenylyltransferase [Candidatus Omnitrophota bacterium]MBU2045079.1 glucose-1-phosphate adenylyltransferase [Candidatus Omnitrophota bacterium]MBU2251755.1 glucose-1-phosphate adenylyltransferase [Candidatus Omnitrophota bacterium]MBU2473184.1 glucose-1-phosphate adenylyltransferase [Candidatus Omnitrophota bacterium]